MPLLRRMPDGRKPVWTYGFCIACIAVFLADRASAWLVYGLQAPAYSGILTQLGARVNSAIAAGQYWRLLTPVFLHGGILHLFMNVLALLIWGPIAEYFFTKKRYWLLLLGSGFLGCVAGFAFSSSSSVGASGAVFGILGAFLSIRSQNRAFFDRFFGIQILIYIGISLGMGFLQGSIDNWGHIGGLAGGYLLGLAFGFGPFRGRTAVRAGAAALFIVICAAGMAWGFTRW